MAERLPCCVPFCRRTTRNDEGYSDWICGRHWSAVPRDLRHSHNLARRRVRKIVTKRPIYREYWKMKAGSPPRLRAVAMWRRLDQAWQRCEQAAIESAAGIS